MPNTSVLGQWRITFKRVKKKDMYFSIKAVKYLPVLVLD